MKDLADFASRPAPTRWVGRPLVLKSVTASTNDDARAAAIANAAAGYAVVADAQTAGRGRRGRSWHSPPGASVYLSVVVRPALAPADAPLVTLAAGLAVADAVAEFAPDARATIKWPNDVRLDGRKVAGVLVEGSLRGGQLAWAVLGVGLNVGKASIPQELSVIATSLEHAAGAPIDRAAVLRALLRALERRLDELAGSAGRGRVVAAVTARCDTLGTHVHIDDVRGVAEALSPSGGLLVRGEDGALTEVRSGEIR